MEKYCQACDKPNPPDAVFCRHCASSQFRPAATRPTAQQSQGQFGNPGWNPPPAANMQAPNFANTASAGASGRAIASLVLAIASLVLCCGLFTGIPAAILGWMEIGAIKEGRASPRGMVMAQIGLWGGIGISVLSLIFSFLYLLLLLGSGMQGF